MLDKDIFQVITKYIKNPFNYFIFSITSSTINKITKSNEIYEKMKEKMQDLRERKIEYFIECLARIQKINKKKIIRIFEKIFPIKQIDNDFYFDEIKDTLAQDEREDECASYYEVCTNDNADEYFMRIIRNMHIDMVSQIQSILYRKKLLNITAFEKNNYIVYDSR